RLFALIFPIPYNLHIAVKPAATAMVLPPIVLLGSVMHVLPTRQGRGEACAAPRSIRPRPLVIRGSLRRFARMRKETGHSGIYYGWVITATTCVMAFLAMGGGGGFGVFVLPMSEEFGWQRGTISLAAALGALSS